MPVPINLKTGKRLKAISVQDRKVWESHPMTKGQFRYEDDPKPAKPPKESKKSTGRKAKT